MRQVAKSKTAMGFDSPVVGPETLRAAAAAKVRAIAVESGCTLLLEKETLIESANRSKITLFGRK